MAIGGTYAFADVSATLTGLGGTLQLGSGSASSEEGITLSMVEDKNTMTMGADGSWMHSLHSGNGATVTVRLLKTSPLNAQLSQMYDIQKASSLGWGKNVLVINHSVSGDSISCAGVAFKKQPDFTYAKDGGANEWTFDVGQVETLLGKY